MSNPCPALPPGAGFVSSITGHIDCQAEMLGSGAWQALAAPGSTLTVVLAGFLTIFIALVGYNLLLGSGMTVRSGTLAFVKIGAIFALATSWPAYRTLVYDLVTTGPAQLVSEIGPSARVVGSDGTLVQRLDLADRAIAQLGILGPGSSPPNTAVQVPPPPFGGFDAFALGGSRIVFLLTAIAALGVIKIITGLMLALGPFFIAFLMFDSTRSLFEGWVRVLGGGALAGIGVAIALGLQLAFIEPWLGTALARRLAGEALPTIGTELFVIVCLFAILVIAAVSACGRVARAFRLPLVLALGHSGVSVKRGCQTTPAAGQRSTSLRDQHPSERSHAAAMASVLTSMTRRDLREPSHSGAVVGASGRMPGLKSGTSEQLRSSVPLGQTYGPRSRSRVSPTAIRRDSAS